jgi:nucleoside-diphosphate-sugar epimerase
MGYKALLVKRACPIRRKLPENPKRAIRRDFYTFGFHLYKLYQGEGPVKILVTGATGFLGGHLVEELVAKGYSVRALVRRTSNTALLRELGVEIIEGDITKPETLGPATRGVDVVVHLAAYYTFFGKKELYELVNVKGTRWLAEASLQNNVDRFI